MNFQNFGNPMLLQQNHQPITVQQLQQLQQLQQQQAAQQQQQVQQGNPQQQQLGHLVQTHPQQGGQQAQIQLQQGGAATFQQLQNPQGGGPHLIHQGAGGAIQLQAAGAFQQQAQPQQVLQGLGSPQGHHQGAIGMAQQTQQQQQQQMAGNNLVQTKNGLKDKNKPKNPMSSYACFIQVIREEHRRKHPNEHVDFSEFSKKCAEKWRSMSDIEKKRFDDLAQADRLRFNREMGQYIPPDGVRGKKRKMPKDPNKPKRAWSAFFFFCDEFRPKIREDHPEWRVGEVAKELGKMWENCADKNKYETLAQNARQRYEEEMVQFRAGTFRPHNTANGGAQGGGGATLVVEKIEETTDHGQILHQQLVQQQQQSNQISQQQQLMMQQQMIQQQQIGNQSGAPPASSSTPTTSTNNNNGAQMQHIIQQQQMMHAAIQQQHQTTGVSVIPANCMTPAAPLIPNSLEQQQQPSTTTINNNNNNNSATSTPNNNNPQN